MAYSPTAFERRAAECARLANGAHDEMIQMELLKLRQTYLQIARRLRALREEEDGPRIDRPPPGEG